MDKAGYEKYCTFQEWNQATKAMGHCPEIATHTVAEHPLCEFHARYVRGIRSTTSRTMDQPMLEIRQ